MSKQTVPSYLPWLRTGLASHITDAVQNGIAQTDTTSVSAVVQLVADGPTEVRETISGPDIRLRGPGEVVGLDPTLVARHDPEPGTADAENTYLALIEFSAPDLPWRYTPARAADDSPNQLQPWIVLVVVEERDGVWLETGGSSRLPVLHVDDIARELPNLEQSWAWAHVHANHALNKGVASALAESPEAFRSRLLCPRRLSANRAWLACVVPAFESCRRAGLGEGITANAGLAWDSTSHAELRLPVYHYWRFQTGPKGDFESLVRRLKAREMPASVGRRDLDISQPGGGVLSSKNTVISYQGALVSPKGQPRPWSADHRLRFKESLRKLLNAELVRAPQKAAYDALRDDPVVGPPSYAGQQAQRKAVPAENSPPAWFGELNTEPQHRTVAGLGTAVIRQDQEALMASAWEHAASTREASQILNRARTAWEVARRARTRLETLPDASFVQIAGPAMARLHHPAGKTFRGVVVESALPGGLLSGAFRRRSHSVPGFLQTTESGRIPLTRAITQKSLADPVGFVAQWAAVRSPVNADVENEILRASTARIGRTVPIDIDIEVKPRIDVVVTPYTGSDQWVKTLASASRNALNPTAAIQSMVTTRIHGLTIENDKALPDRVFTRPVFTTPMYQRLAALSVEYLVPGIGEIPNDTLGLLVTNPPFIEAYMAGLNHEMGREFLWREYPARLSDTWFQTFWSGGPQAAADIRPIRSWLEKANLGENAPPNVPQASLVLLIRSAILRRYPEMRVYAAEAVWKKKDGQDVRREAAQGEIKTPIFTARLTTDITVFGFELEEDQARGSLNPNMHPGYFFVLEQPAGLPRFGLDAKRRPGRNQELSEWTDLSWSDLTDKDGKPPAFIDVDLPLELKNAGPLPTNSDDKTAKDSWGTHAAAMARITFQRPVRMLVHADSMLPAAIKTKRDKK